MPKEWYNYATNIVKSDDSDEIIAKKCFNQSICAHKKPYFFIYNYDAERIKYQKFIDEVDSKSISLYGISFKDMQKISNLDENMDKFVKYCMSKSPIDISPSTMNRISWKIEQEFESEFYYEDVDFNYEIYKSINNIKNISYSDIKNICEQYLINLKALNSRKINSDDDRKILLGDRARLLETLIEDITTICPNSEILCNTLLDICYSGKMSKSIVWDVCGSQIIKNMLKKHNNILIYPEKNGNGDFCCCGTIFSNKIIEIRGEDIDEI